MLTAPSPSLHTRILRLALGASHPIARVVAELAERTTSETTRLAAERRRATEQAAIIASELAASGKGPAAAAALDPNS